MPGRLRQKSGVQTEEAPKEQTYNIPGLDFTETLTWRAGKAIPVADLLSRLQDLSEKLRSLDDAEVESRQFTGLSQDLANANLLGHKDKGIRAWTISCIVDVLKLCAPDAPFKDIQLKDIFNVVINSILPALADPTNAYNSQHVYILQSLAESQSILLVTDIPHPDSLITALFTHCFDIISGSNKNSAGVELAKSVEYHLKNLLCAVVEEAALPQEVTDIIISQFMRVDAKTVDNQSAKGKKHENQDEKQSTLLLKDYPPAYNMAKSICTACSEKMTALITQYFGAVIVDASGAIQSNGHSKTPHRRTSDLNESDDDQDELADLRKAHRLLRELWRACPDVLLNVIPQIEAELSADSSQLRQLATETLGDIAAGIGIAGLAPPTTIDPAAYPLPSLSDSEPPSLVTNPLLNPASPKPFSTVHASAYQSFLGRRNDKVPEIRAIWASAASRILLTSAGGIGMSDTEQQELLSGYAQMLRDHEERVRLSAIKATARFSYHGLINILCADGGLSKSGTVLSTFAERVTDKRNQVREESIAILARFWGVASRDVEEGNETVITVLGELPTRLLMAYYTNDAHIHAILDKVMYESLLPLSFPPVKSQPVKQDGQKSKAKNKGNSSQEEQADPDAIRARRILTLLQSFDAKSKQVFFGMQGRQAQLQRAVSVFLKACEDYNGGIVEDNSNETKIKQQLTTYIEALSKPFPDSSKMAADLWKFAKLHNRRDYQLIRFAMGPEYDYRTMYKAIKELTKRIREGPSNTQSLIESLMPLLYRCALIVYNRSHVPTIMDMSRSDQNGLSEIAHEVLKEISARNPEILKTHIQALCKELESNAPSATNQEEAGSGDTLKACAAFARKYPTEIPKDRKFLTALTGFALFSRSPRAAKNAVSIILTVADKKEMYAKEILTKALKDCHHSSPHFLARLAAIAQVCLLTPNAATAETERILKLAIADTLHQNRTASKDVDENAWEQVPSDETLAKELALKIMVNRCRSENEKENSEEFEVLAKQVFNLLLQLVTNNGEMTPSEDTPPAQRNHLRLTAARFILKLCKHKRRCEELVSPSMFLSVSLIVINPPNAVRSGFVNQVKKYLGQNSLNHRWFTVLFLMAFEPDIELRTSTITWLRSRVQYFARQQQFKSTDKKVHQNVLESTFSRLLSLLAHHPDYPDHNSEDFDDDLLDFSRYIIFYLVAIATEDNLSLIFHIAQRVKQTRDAITDLEDHSERLYVLSDLAQAVIRNYADLMPAHAKGVNLLQTWPGSVALPKSLFKALPSHETAQEIAEKNYLPEDTALGLEKLIRSYVKSTKPGQQRKHAIEKKRKGGSIDLEEEDEERKSAKKPKKTNLPIRRTPKKTMAKRRGSDPLASSEMKPSRKSTRVSGAAGISYAEGDSEDDDAEMDEYDQMAGSPVLSRSQKGKLKQAKPSPAKLEKDSKNKDVEMSDPAVDLMPDTNGNEHKEEAEADEEEVVDEDVSGQEASPEVEAEAENEDQEDSATEREPSPTPAKATRSTRGKEQNKPAPASKPSTPAKKGKEPPAKEKKAPVTTKNSASAKGKAKEKPEKDIPTSPATETRETRRSARNKG